MNQKPPIYDVILHWAHKGPGGVNHKNLERVEGEHSEGKKKKNPLHGKTIS